MSTGANHSSKNTRKIVIQAAFLFLVGLMIWGAISSARTNLDAMGLSNGFGFLERSTGWSYSFSLVDRSIDDPYRWTLFVGFLNTLFLGVLSIILATILGFLIGTARDAKNIAVNSAATIFVQIFRNIPLILQLVFWYAVLIHMPRVKVWNEEMGEAEGLAAPLKHTGVLALTDRRLLFFRKRFAIGRPKTIIGDWPLGQIAAIAYEADDNTVTVTFSDGSSAGLHSPANQWPHKLVEGFARLKNLGN